jgi:hypothetical protein
LHEAEGQLKKPWALGADRPAKARTSAIVTSAKVVIRGSVCSRPKTRSTSRKKTVQLGRRDEDSATDADDPELLATNEHLDAAEAQTGYFRRLGHGIREARSRRL